MINIAFKTTDDYEKTIKKLKAFSEILSIYFATIDGKVVDLVSGQLRNVSPVLSIESDEVNEDLETHEETYDHTLLHEQLHDMDSADDHNSPAGTENNLVDFDASGYPVDDSGLTVTDTSDAISKKHTRLHDMDGSSDHNSPSGTENNLVDFDANGYPVDDSGVAVSDVSTAVTKTHDRQHSLTSSDDHTSGATSGQMLKGDANGLPIDATNTDAQVSDAVTKAHAQNTDTDLDATFEATLMDCDNHTSGSTNFVLAQQAAEADLNQTITDPPTQAEVQAITDKIDALLAKLRSANVLAT